MNLKRSCIRGLVLASANGTFTPRLGIAPSVSLLLCDVAA